MISVTTLRQRRCRIDVRLEAPAQLDRVQRELLGELVDRAFERERSDPFARRPHERIRYHVDIDDVLRDAERTRRIQVPCWERELLGTVVVRRHRGVTGVNERRERTVPRRHSGVEQRGVFGFHDLEAATQLASVQLST